MQCRRSLYELGFSEATKFSSNNEGSKDIYYEFVNPLRCLAFLTHFPVNISCLLPAAVILKRRPIRNLSSMSQKIFF